MTLIFPLIILTAILYIGQAFFVIFVIHLILIFYQKI